MANAVLTNTLKGRVDSLLSKDYHATIVAGQIEGKHLYTFLPILSTDRDLTGMGEIVGATPNGRRDDDPISENQSPSAGADSEDLTAVLNSVARMPFTRLPANR
jgi:hypothetical protein